MRFFNILRDAAVYWSENQAPRRAAALTYYVLASLAPMLVLLLSIAGLFFNPERAADALTGPISVAIGADYARTFREMIETAYNPGGSITAGGFSILVTIITGSSLFRQLGLSLNQFLRYEQEDTGELPLHKKAIRVILREAVSRLRAFLIVLGAGMLLIAGLLTSTLFGAGQEYLGNFIDFPFEIYTWVSRVFTLLFTTILFALIYRFATRKQLSWKAVRQGAFIAGVMFTLLQEFLGAFLISNRLTTTYGAAASLVALLFWLYYSIQVLFFGAAWARIDSAREASSPE